MYVFDKEKLFEALQAELDHDKELAKLRNDDWDQGYTAGLRDMVRVVKRLLSEE